MFGVGVVWSGAASLGGGVVGVTGVVRVGAASPGVGAALFGGVVVGVTGVVEGGRLRPGAGLLG